MDNLVGSDYKRVFSPGNICSSELPRQIERGNTIAVVGGGISGVCAAHLCSKSCPDADILLIEKGDFVGGRLLTSFGKDERRYPLGAMRFHKSKTPLTNRMLEWLGITSKPWPYLLDRIVVDGTRLGEAHLFPHFRSAVTTTLPVMQSGLHLQDLIERHLERGAGDEPISIALASLPEETRRLLVLSSGYNCASVLPSRYAKGILSGMPETNPAGWMVPDGGYISAYEALLLRLPKGVRLLRHHKLGHLDREGTGFTLGLATPMGEHRVFAHKVILALGKGDLSTITGNLSGLLFRIDETISCIPKFRMWMRCLASMMPEQVKSEYLMAISDEVFRKVYMSRNDIMIYNDCHDAETLNLIAAQGEAVLVKTVCDALARVFGTRVFSPAHIDEVHWKFWETGIQYLRHDDDRHILDTLPDGIVVTNAAFSDHHGFVEGDLQACAEQCAKLFQKSPIQLWDNPCQH